MFAFISHYVTFDTILSTWGIPFRLGLEIRIVNASVWVMPASIVWSRLKWMLYCYFKLVIMNFLLFLLTIFLLVVFMKQYLWSHLRNLINSWRRVRKNSQWFLLSSLLLSRIIYTNLRWVFKIVQICILERWFPILWS